MARRASQKVFSYASDLRRNPTEAESRLWRFLRAHRIMDIHFRRQHAIGPYIVDFCAPRHNLVIELDGGQHLEHEDYDNARTAYLMAEGYRVLRFWDNEVMNDLESVLTAIMDEVEKTAGSAQCQ